ncbi:MAG: SLBB domain-containing protein [Burkholderiales bacterium]|nr:SLBB domain-containing protein [Burkholderiales bacterium]
MKYLTMALLCLMSLVVWAEDDYLLGVGDIVKVVVYDHPDLTTEVALGTGGKLTFPLVGEVGLEGKTASQAEALLSDKLKTGGFIKTPSVNVMVTQYRSQRVSVVGEVFKPGRYVLDGPTSLVDMLATAGGITPNGGDVIVLRRGEHRVEFTIPKLMGNTDQSLQSMDVVNGDVLYVPRMQQVYVYGEVNRPGAFRLEQHMNAMQALSLAGGFTPRASHSRLKIHRTEPDGSIKKMSITLTDTLQADDVLFVDESIF